MANSYIDNTVSVIDTESNTVTATVNVGSMPVGIAVNPTGTKVYVTNHDSNTVSVIDTASNTVTAMVDVGISPFGVAVNPTGTKVYVTNANTNTVSVIDTASNTVTTTVNVGNFPYGVAVNPDGTNVYVTNENSNTVSVIDTGTNEVKSTVSVGRYPNAFGQFIVPPSISEPVIPVADFWASPTIGTSPLEVKFTDQSTGSPTSWLWNLGDKRIATDQSPVHQYTKAGKYTVSLTVKNDLGSNTRKISRYITVNK